MSSKLHDSMIRYGVHLKVSTVWFPQENCWAEVAMKTARLLLRAHLSQTGTLNTVEIIFSTETRLIRILRYFLLRCFTEYCRVARRSCVLRVGLKRYRKCSPEHIID